MSRFLIFVSTFILLSAPAFSQSNPRAILKKWDAKDERILKKSISNLESYLDNLQYGISEFTAEAYSLGFKFKALFNKNYPKQVWQRHMFSQDQVDRNIQSIINNFIEEIEGNRNQYLLKTKASLECIGKVNPKLDIKQFSKIFPCYIDRLSKNTANHAIATEFVTLVVGEIVAQIIIDCINYILAELAIEGTMASLGGATSFGIGLIVIVTVDYIINDYAKANMEKKLKQELENLKATIMSKIKPIMKESLKHYKVKKRQEVLKWLYLD